MIDPPVPPGALNRGRDHAVDRAPEGLAAGRRWSPGAAAWLGGLALVLAFRALYLARFGQDPCWMNDNFLLEAKAMRFGYAVELRMPLMRLYLAATRSAGASVAVSLGVAYMTAHALFAAGVFALARTILGARLGARPGMGARPGARTDGGADSGPRLWVTVAIAVAVLPALASDSGYRNISCTVGAALFTALAGLLLAGPPRPLRLAVGALLAAGAASCRPESALCVAGLALALALGGRRWGGAGRAGAAVAAVGLAAGIFGAPLLNQSVAAAAGPSAQVWGSYSFYAFYNTIPFALRLVSNLRHPGSTATEYLRYAQAVRLFGGFAENGGSILHALLHHPARAAIWLAAKPLDFLETIVLPDSFTPLVIVLYVLAGRRLRREGASHVAARWAPLLAAFAAPFCFLLFWSSGHAPYLLFVAPLLLLAALWGLEPWIARAPATGLRGLAAGLLALAALLVALTGHPRRDSSTAPALRWAAAWLERRCAADGCLVNALPAAIDVQAWANLQAGAPLPLKDKRAEAFALKRYSAAYLTDVRWERRLAEARAHGGRGPIFYVRSTTRSVKSFDDDFDPEHRLEGAPDLAGARLAATFHEDDGAGAGKGADLVEIFELDSGSPSAPRL